MPSPSFSLVAHAQAAYPSTSTPGVDTTGASLLLVQVSFYLANGYPTTLTDTYGNAWNVLGAVQADGIPAACVATYYAVHAPTVGPGHSVSWTGGSSVCAQFSAWYSSTGGFEEEEYFSAGGQAPISGRPTVTATNRLVITGASCSNNANLTGAGTGWTTLNNLASVPSTTFSTANAYYTGAGATADAIWANDAPGGNAFTAYNIFSFAPSITLTGNLTLAYTPGANRNNFDGRLGVTFTATTGQTYDHIGLRKATGNSGFHSVALFDAGGTQLRQANVDLTGGTVGTLYYAPITSITLTSGAVYHLSADVFNGGQFCSDQGPTTLAAGVTSIAAAWYNPGSGWNTDNANYQYVGVDLALAFAPSNTTWSVTDKTNVTLSGGNLTATATGAGFVRAGKQLAGSGKFYWEVRASTWSSGNTAHGFCPSAFSSPSGASASGLLGVYNSGNIWLNASNTGSSLGPRANNDIIAIALDTTAKLVWLRVAPSGNWNGSGTANPATGVGGINVASILSADACPLAAFGGVGGDVAVANFGDTAFTGTVPSGFTSGFPAPPPNTTWNPSDKTGTVTLSGGNLITSNSGQGGVRSTDRQVSGKFYWEVSFAATGSNTGVGIANAGADIATAISTGAGAAICNNGGGIAINGVGQTGIGAFSAGVVCCMALDLDSRLMWFRNGAAGNWNNSATANPTTGAGGYSVAAIGGIGVPVYAFAGSNGTTGTTANFGDSAFTGAVPSGFISGFPTGATSPTNALVTQAGVEQWATATDVPAQVTQVALEHWASVSSGAVQAVVTQVALEEWAAVVPAIITNAQVTQVALEEWASVGPTFEYAKAGGLERENLITAVARANVAGLVREVLVASEYPFTRVRVGGLVREALVSGTIIPQQYAVSSVS